MDHGSKKFNAIAPSSKFYKGPFGRLFPDLPAWDPEKSGKELEQFLKTISNELMVEKPGILPAEIAENDELRKELEQKFNSNVPAGYTYFGQFIDHDITFDPASSLMRQNDPNGLQNFRTPRLDLDNVYGSGAEDQPYLYDPKDKAKFLIGGTKEDPSIPDLPRIGDVALIGDPRNDENAIVSQIQLAFLLAHNNLVDRVRAKDKTLPLDEVFERARRTLRWLYQYILWNDFMSRIVIDEVYKIALSLDKTKDGREKWVCGLKDIYKWRHQPFMPIEFSIAAYRFGHSMVRNSYQTNAIAQGFGNFLPIFDHTTGKTKNDLRGGKAMTPEKSIQWDCFLPMKSSREDLGFPQMARKIDTKLSNALGFLPIGDPNDQLNVLAFRNLKRSLSFDLPSGSSVAKKFGIEPIKLDENEPDSLWYYILKEGQRNSGNTLGRVGSIIICSVFAGLLKSDPNSWISLEPCWTPDKDPLLLPADKVDSKKWELSSIIRLAGLKADGIGFIEKDASTVGG